MKTSQIIDAINQKYVTALENQGAEFVGKDEMWSFCIKSIQDPITMSCIVFANDFKIPPVESLLTIYNRKNNPSPEQELSNTQKLGMGKLMSFVFKDVLGYQSQEECKVENLAIQSATRYFNGPIVEFEE